MNLIVIGGNRESGKTVFLATLLNYYYRTYPQHFKNLKVFHWSMLSKRVFKNNYIATFGEIPPEVEIKNVTFKNDSEFVRRQLDLFKDSGVSLVFLEFSGADSVNRVLDFAGDKFDLVGEIKMNIVIGKLGGVIVKDDFCNVTVESVKTKEDVINAHTQVVDEVAKWFLNRYL